MRNRTPCVPEAGSQGGGRWPSGVPRGQRGHEETLGAPLRHTWAVLSAPCSLLGPEEKLAELPAFPEVVSGCCRQPSSSWVVLPGAAGILTPGSDGSD